MYILYSKSLGPFKEYIPPIPDNTFKPLGKLTLLTPEEFQNKQDFYNDYISNNPI